MEGNRDIAAEKGIIPNSFAHIFSHIARESDNVRFLVRVSYMEIYNEECHDLLTKNPAENKRLEVGSFFLIPAQP